MSLTGNIVRAIKAEDDAKPSPIFHKQKSTTKRENKEATQSARTCSFRLPTTKALTPLKHLKYVGSKAVGVLRMLSPKRNSPKVTSSERANANAIVANLDSQRAQAIDDCIEFINSSSSSSSLSRSKSLSH